MRTKAHLPLKSLFGAFALAILAGASPAPVVAQDGDGVDAVDVFGGQTSVQLQSLVAPIALYPDPLVAQILQASTYPDQISQAAADVMANPGQPLGGESWDASVLAVSHYPPVIEMMAKQLQWTTQLGHAYLAQQGQVLTAIQAMRQQAINVGNLKTTPQQQVVSSGGAIQVYPTDPNLFYIPTYDPLVVYNQPAAWGAAPMVGFDAGWAVGDDLAGTSVDWVGGSVVNYPTGYGWRNAYSNGGYHAVVGQTANGASYAGQSESSTLARGGDLTRYQGAAVGWDGTATGHGATYSNGDTDAGAFSRTVTTNNGVYTIHGAAGTNGTSSGGYANVTGVNREGQVTNDTVTDRNGDVTTTRSNDIFDSPPRSENLFSEAHSNDWNSAYADRGAWSRNSFGGGAYGGGSFGGFRGGGFRR